MNYFQHGDVILEKVNPQDIELLGLETADSNAIQFGEVTGHAHRLYGDHRIMFRRGDLDDSGNGPKILIVNTPCELKHEEHNTLKLPPGVYKSRIVREYDHFAEEARNVRD